MSKRQLLLELGQKRRRAAWPGYANIGDYHDGAYECDFVSPYTKSAANVDAALFVLLQDWSSDDRLRGPVDLDAQRFGLTRHLPTNVNLTALLRSHFNVGLGDVYATNLLPFIKKGGLSSPISQRDLVRAAHEFALPQLRIVRPRLVVCLGLKTFNAIRVACGHGRAKRLAEAIHSPFTVETVRVWAQAHTGARGQSNRNRGHTDRVSADWARMKNEFAG